ncbi:response regulator [Dyella sp.]|jgi:CheY-like chemotaxis protein|uniref:response regulator n=1 Tax=Dyella sp. TaxID=1869338 RepID=UPI002D788D6B|nr:response regulator [Dyella sp.]HET6430975.1 response regulator [Dyella sp.]
MRLSFDYGVPAFQFPTTTVMVDDHESYLGVVPLMLDPLQRLKSYSSPRQALADLRHNDSRDVPGGGWLYRWHEHPSPNRELVALDIDSIVRTMHDPARFAEVSVVVVDQAMPEMDGLEFCRQIANPHIGKVLLTGRADDETAIEAFNSGLIDRFIRKNDPKAMEKLQQAIVTLQQRYFERAGRFVSEAMALGDVRFLRDPVFVPIMRRIVADFAAIECYLHVNPTGLLLLDADGDGRFVLIQTDDDLRTHYEIASDLGASIEVLNALRDGTALPWFASRDGFYSGEPDAPPVRMVPATTVRGEHWYHYAVIDDVNSRFELDRIVCYRRWLREQDGSAPAG